MNTHQSSRIAASQAGALLASLLLAAVPVRAQQPSAAPPQADPRWEAWLGCWEPVSGPVKVAGDTASTPLVCVVPAPGSVGVDVATISGGKVVARTLVEATGEQRTVSRDGCSGWESAQFSAEAQRVYLTAEYTCPGDIKRTTNELMAITPAGDWLDVRGASVRGLPEGVRVLRYRLASGAAAVPGDLAWALQGNAMAVMTAREAAGAPPEPEDVIEAAHRLAPAIVEAWVVEEGEPFQLDAKRLAQLKDAGVPDRVIDVMVAVSYPSVFAIDVASHQGQRRAPEYGSAERAPVYGMGYASPFGCYSPYSWDCYSPYGWGYYSPFFSSPYGYYSPYGYWSGYGYYPSGGIVVVSGGGGQAARHGRMVIGRGYTQGAPGQAARPERARGSSRSSGSGSGSERRATGSSGSSSSGSGSSSAGSSSGSSSSGSSSSGSSSSGSSSSGSSTGRTAHPKP